MSLKSQGNISSGKTTLLESLIGSTERTVGTCTLNARGGRVAYAEQTPSFINGTIKDNVTFGAPEVDEHALKVALAGSQLAKDMDDLGNMMSEKRELTETGARGSKLSGGQKLGVAMARCIYAVFAEGVDTVMLDDPLAPLDAKSRDLVWKKGAVPAPAHPASSSLPPTCCWTTRSEHSATPVMNRLGDFNAQMTPVSEFCRSAGIACWNDAYHCAEFAKSRIRETQRRPTRTSARGAHRPQRPASWRERVRFSFDWAGI